jgi:D-alanyl-D-alanine-carboxypeptidase/D-alanyl-D-alanine-endopeptidase
MKRVRMPWAGSFLLLSLALVLPAPVMAQQSPAAARQSPTALQQAPVATQPSNDAAAPSRSTRHHFPADSDLETMLRYVVEDGETPGAVLGVLEADGSTRIVSYGTGGPDTRRLGPLSEFEIGSINKTFTATLLADMVLRGEVSLDDPVQKYMPDSVTVPSRNGHQITLENLATHTSGLPRMATNYRPHGLSNPYADYDLATLYRFLNGYTLPRDPGAEYEYSNLGFGLLGHALARAAGMSYRDLLRQRVLEPLGMDRTAYAFQGPAAEWMTQGHANGVWVHHWTATPAIEGAGGLLSDAHDMLAYLNANVNPPDTELGRAMALAQQVLVPEGNQGAGHGLAWSIGIVAGHKVVGHNGGTGGYGARLWFDPDRHIGTVLLANTQQLKDNLATALLLLAPAPASWNVPTPPARDLLASYAGTYRVANVKTRYYIRLEDDGFLTYQATGLVRTRLYARSDSSFFILRGPWTFTFRKDGQGNVTGMVMEVDRRAGAQAGATRTAIRVSDDTPRPDVVAGNAGFRAAVGNFARRTGLTLYYAPRTVQVAIVIVLVAGLGLLVFWLLRRRRKARTT